MGRGPGAERGPAPGPAGGAPAPGPGPGPGAPGPGPGAPGPGPGAPGPGTPGPGPGAPGAPARADVQDLRASCVRFGRLLRTQGLPVGPEQVRRWLRALDVTALAHPADLYWTGRLTLVCHQPHLAVYDELFRQFWLMLDHAALNPVAGHDAGPLSRAIPRRTFLSQPEQDGDRLGSAAPSDAHPGTSPTPTDSAPGDLRWSIGAPFVPPGAVPDRSEDSPDPSTRPGTGWYSDLELLRDKDFAAYTDGDGETLERLLAQNGLWLAPLIRSRRCHSSPTGDRLDIKRTVLEAIRTGGEPLQVRWRERSRNWRKWVFLCDISASMAPYLSGLLRFLQAVAARRRATEVFVFGTRLTRVTPYLRRQRAGRLSTALTAVRDWHGGTRLGESLQQFLRVYGRRGMAHGAVLFVLSDGLDLGRPGLTAQAMARMDRAAARIAWINPLKRSGEYTPTAQAMAEALPFIDDFSSGHTLRSLTELIQRQAEADR